MSTVKASSRDNTAASLTLRVVTSLSSLSDELRRVLMNRASDGDISARDVNVRDRTSDIIADVQKRGDVALHEMARDFDGVQLSSLEIPRVEWKQALRELDSDLRVALERSVANIRAVHSAFMPTSMETSPEPGITVGRRVDPLARVGVYAPGGRAAYPSSLFMGAIPARVAGVGEVIVCTPPSSSGKPSAVVLAAAELANVDRVFAVGGAGAIAAMALGTESIPRVDRIVGPGNAYVAEAKLQLVGSVAIDSPAGPSELLVLADDSANVEVLARELAAQAEHDPQAAVIAVIFGARADELQQSLLSALEQVVSAAPRADIIRASLAARGAILTGESADEAIEFSNNWAAEHLLLSVAPANQERVLARLRAAGTIFIGESSAVAFGDYMTGANHVLPTGGLARCYSGLSTMDFVRWTSWQRVTPEAAARLAGDVGVFADAEGLPAHALAARSWEKANASAAVQRNSKSDER
ncbi:MAG: histidinol dehydrogenase [Gemmatimonadaceae bacterium]